MHIKNIIIGAGPAGIQMANLLADEEYLIIEKASVPCSFFHKFPRHRKFISANKSRNLRLDWNSFLGDYLSFRDYSEELYPHVDDYLKYVNDFVKLRNIIICNPVMFEEVCWKYTNTTVLLLRDGAHACRKCNNVSIYFPIASSASSGF